MSNIDFLGIQETHGTPGRERMYQGISGVTSYWSHMSRSQGGVGLFVRDAFLQRFATRSWEVIEDGRVAVLRLRGSAGGFDIWVCYLSATATEGRIESIERMSSNIACKSEVTSLVFGDFNFTEHKLDRFQKNAGQWSGHNNRGETLAWNRSMVLKHGFAEWEQDQMTCETGVVLSRIDRVYCNQHVAEQLDRQLVCTTLPPSMGLSAHRPLHFAKLQPQSRDAQILRPLPASAIQHPDFERLVGEHYDMQLRGHPDAKPLQRLGLLKLAFRRAAATIRLLSQVAKSSEEKLGITMAVLRRLEKNCRADVSDSVASYPHLGSLIQDSNITCSLVRIRNHAIELANID
eukprot:2643783-Karenia_brevis.AAC.1